MNVLKIIAFEEGFMPKPYLCSEGFVTIGLGTKLHKSKGMNPEDFPIRVSRRMAEEWLSTEVDIKHRKLETSERRNVYDSLSHDRRSIIISMAYQMGTAGVLGFSRMWGHIARGDYFLAAIEMLDSKWARDQSPERAQRHVRVMRGETLENVYTD